MTASPTAVARGISNRPTAEVIGNLKRTAAVLEQVRVLLGNRPILVSSGYRCPELNKAVGGSPDSAHLYGLAADFICPSFGTPAEIWRFLSQKKFDFDQLIVEYGRWIHLGLSMNTGGNRRQVLTIQ